MKGSGCFVAMADEPNNSPGRQKMSDDVTTSENLNEEYRGGDSDNASSFDDADGIKSGLSRRSPMNNRAKYNDAMGVNSKSRSKYDGSN